MYRTGGFHGATVIIIVCNCYSLRFLRGRYRFSLNGLGNNLNNLIHRAAVFILREIYSCSLGFWQHMVYGVKGVLLVFAVIEHRSIIIIMYVVLNYFIVSLLLMTDAE